MNADSIPYWTLISPIFQNFFSCYSRRRKTNFSKCQSLRCCFGLRSKFRNTIVREVSRKKNCPLRTRTILPMRKIKETWWFKKIFVFKRFESNFKKKKKNRALIFFSFFALGKQNSFDKNELIDTEPLESPSVEIENWLPVDASEHFDFVQKCNPNRFAND